MSEEVLIVQVYKPHTSVKGFGFRFVDVDDEADCCVAEWEGAGGLGGEKFWGDASATVFGE